MNRYVRRVLKGVTVKMVCITGLFLLTTSPFCIAFAHAAFNVPGDMIASDMTANNAIKATKYSTKLHDHTFLFPLLNGMIQPVVYILSFESLREIFVKMLRCENKNQEQNTARAIFRASHSLSGNFVESEKHKSEEEEHNPADLPESRKHSAVSQVTILSCDESIAVTNRPMKTD